ncbi:hypothetical protein [Effusibacillus pohliae]|uniref:hypothetical protein n=1 Tax=Effusibacillus pohliae TaxID=232270 RepID=UPI0003692983|nr:hypothetical protein [Effusibacillus pohliae]
MKKWLTLLMTLALMFGTAGSALAASSSKGTFSGTVRSSQTPVSGSHFVGSYGTSSSSQTYSSGPKSPSANVTQRPSYPTPVLQPSTQTKSSVFGGLGHFFGGLATGAVLGSLLGHMLHPFGGFGHGFSIWGLLFDAVLAYLIYKLVRRFMGR